MEREFLTSELKELLEKRNKKGNSTAHWHNPLVDGGNIMGSELEIGRDVNEDVAAISVRRDKDLYGFISPKQFLDGLTSKQKDLKQTVEFLNAHAVPKSDPKFNSIRSAPISNITRIKLKQEQQKEQVNALQSGLMQAAGIAVEGAGLYYTTGAAATLLSATGWGLIAVGVILLIPEILALDLATFLYAR